MTLSGIYTYALNVLSCDPGWLSGAHSIDRILWVVAVESSPLFSHTPQTQMQRAPRLWGLSFKVSLYSSHLLHNCHMFFSKWLMVEFRTSSIRNRDCRVLQTRGPKLFRLLFHAFTARPFRSATHLRSWTPSKN